MKHLYRCAAVLAVITLFSACKKDWNELGSQLIVVEDLEVLSFEDQQIKVSIVKEDSLVTLNAPTSFIGSINDPYFGATNASIFTEFRIPSSDVEFGSTAVADSLVLTLDLDAYYGDTLSVLNIQVMKMLELIETTSTDTSGVDSTITIYSSDVFEYDNSVIGELALAVEPNSNSEIKLLLSNELAQEFLDADASNFVDNDAFQTFFNGLYISCGDVASEGVLLELDLVSEKSKLALYYHTDVADSLSYDFQINSNADRMTHWAHDYSSTEIETLIGLESVDKAYVQGSVGLRTYIDLPDLASLRDSNYVIHKAELIIPYISTDLDSIYGTPSQLGLAAVNADGKLEALTEDQNIGGATYFDGNRNELNQVYKFNIARYVQKVIEEGYSSRLALYVPSSISQPERVLINNHFADSIGVSLKLFVSEQ
jgi:hypothetical protein